MPETVFARAAAVGSVVVTSTDPFDRDDRGGDPPGPHVRIVRGAHPELGGLPDAADLDVQQRDVLRIAPEFTDLPPVIVGAPGTSLSERWGFVLRLQMLMNISPSTLAWSLMLITELLLFLVAFAGSGSFLCACVKRAAKLRVPLLPFALLCVPLALIGADIAEKALMAVLPLRYPIAVLLVGMILIFNAFARKKEGKTA